LDGDGPEGRRDTLPKMNALLRLAVGIVTVAVGLVTVGPRLAAAQDSVIDAPPLFDWQFRSWPVGVGGAHPIAQLPDGAIVIGCETGIVRFDGHRMRSLLIPEAATRTAVKLLLVDDAARLHVVCADATHACITADDAWVCNTAANVPAGEGDKGYEPTSICMDRAGNVWVGHRNGLVSRTSGRDTTWLDTATAGTWPGEASVQVASDTSGRVWSARKGRLAVWHDGRWENREVLSSAQLTLAAARDGGLWIRVGGAVFRFVDGLGMTRPFMSGVPTIREMREDAAGRLWMATSRYGLVVWDGNRLATAPTMAPSIFSVLLDGEGGLWAGTSAGLERGEPRIVRRIETPKVKPLRAIRSAADGALWFITLDGEVGSLRRDLTPGPDRTAGWHEGVITALAAAIDGGLWLGTQEGGVVRVAGTDPSGMRQEDLAMPTDLQGLPVRSLAATASGGLWVAIGRHLLWNDGSRWLSCDPSKRGFASEVTLVVEDDAGDGWASLANGSIVHVSTPTSEQPEPVGEKTVDPRIDVEMTTPPDLPAGAVVTAICPLPDGGVWTATRQHGLWRFREGMWTRVGTEHGLPSATLLAAVPDGRGRIWFAGERLFFVATLAELEAVATGERGRCHCWITSGASDLAFFDPVIVPPGIGTRDADGRILIVLPTGLAVCEPDRLRASSPPKVDVVEVRADGRVLAPIAPRGYGMPMDEAVRVPADTRTVTFALAEQCLATPTNARVQHRLAGIDIDWVNTPADRVVNYERLPAGKHPLQFRTTTDRATWQSAVPGITIDVEPRLLERPWFRAAVVLGAAGVAGGVAFGWQAWRSSRRIARLRETAALDRERMRIARDMHDDLGTSLTQISLLTELIRSRATEETAGALDEVTTIAREAVSSLDEIVWAVNPRHDTLPHLLSYVSLQASHMLGQVGIRCTVEAPEVVVQRHAPTEFRRAVLFLVKEAIGNVIKHARAASVALSIRTDEGRLRLVVADDGRGITTPAAVGDRPRPSAGLDNLRERAADLGGSCTVRPRAGGGTIVEIDVPLPSA
jgi:signal transduction histidine kinase/ligand-binding sensor domain-containing protein